MVLRRNPLKRPRFNLLKSVKPINIRIPYRVERFPEISDRDFRKLDSAYDGFTMKLHFALQFITMGQTLDRSSREWKVYVQVIRQYLSFLDHYLMQIRMILGFDICRVSFDAFKTVVEDYIVGKVSIGDMWRIAEQLRREIDEVADRYDIYVID